MKVVIIGTGKMARGIGTRLRAGGHELTILGRDEAKAQALAAELGAHSAQIDPQNVKGEVVVLAVPYRAAIEVVNALAPALAGKVLIDITNPMKPDHAGVTTPPDSSAAEEIQKLLAGKAPVVKAFNAVFASVLVAGKIYNEPPDVYIAGDDTQAKATVVKLVNSGGLHAVDIGPLMRSRQLEQLALLLVQMQQPLGTGYNTAWKMILPE